MYFLFLYPRAVCVFETQENMRRERLEREREERQREGKLFVAAAEAKAPPVDVTMPAYNSHFNPALMHQKHARKQSWQR